MNVETIFFNDKKRLRSGLRLIVFLLAFIFFNALFHLTVMPLLGSFGVDTGPGTAHFIVLNGVFAFFLAIALGWLCGQYLEDLPFRALGVALAGNWLKDLSFGLILGTLALVLAILIGMISGGLNFRLNQENDSGQILTTLVFSLLVFVAGSAFEEAFFRGYMLQTFARARLAWLAIFLTSVFFGLGHMSNPSANLISTLNTILAGIWFSLAYLKTRTLWLPFGLHLIWNWLQGAIFGIEVSGLKELTEAPLLREIETGPAWLTGGDYGIEGGIACTIALVLSTVLIYFAPFLNPTAEMLELTSEERDSGKL